MVKSVKAKITDKSTEDEIANMTVDIEDLKNDEFATVEDLDLVDVLGIGPTVARTMKKNGIMGVTDLAIMTSKELSDKIGKKNEDECYTYIMSAKNLLVSSGLLDKDTKTAEEVLVDEKAKIRLTTGSNELNSLLLGGIETSAVTEFYGQFGSGKSQICHTCAILATTPLEEGGLDGNVLWLDTEGTMRAERLYEIATQREIDPVKALRRIVQMEVMASGQLELIVADLAKYLRKYNPKLIIIDSIIALHRAEFTGRGTLADRQQSLNAILHKLHRVAKIKKIAIIFTNQVSSSPDTFFGNPEKATGGNIIGHGSTYRIGLRKNKNGRVATMIDSPRHPYGSVEFCLNEKGIDDIDKDKLAKKLKEKELEEQEELEN